jgi:hypothetical protein
MAGLGAGAIGLTSAASALTFSPLGGGGGSTQTLSGVLSEGNDVNGQNIVDGGTTIWDSNNNEIPATTIDQTSIDHTNLTNVNSGDHHSRYSDSEAQSAVEVSNISPANSNLDLSNNWLENKKGEKWSYSPQKTERFFIDSENGPDETVDQNVELCQISRDTDDSTGYGGWSHGGVVEITVRNTYYRDGNFTRALVFVSHDNHDKNRLKTIESYGERSPNLFLGSEVDTGAQGGDTDSTIKYSPVYLNVGGYEKYSVEINYSHTRINSTNSFDSNGQIKFPLNWSTGTKGSTAFNPGSELNLENRSNDPSSPKEGRMWIRTDL